MKEKIENRKGIRGQIKEKSKKEDGRTGRKKGERGIEVCR